MKNQISFDLIASATCAAIGAIFIYYALYGEDRNLFHSVFLNTGAAFGFFSLALQPHNLKKNIAKENGLIKPPKFSGTASVLNIIGCFLFIIGLISWTIK